MVQLEHTLKRYPVTAEVQEQCALPFGVTLQPFAHNRDVPLHRQPQLTTAQVPRCSECYAYVNCFCGMDAIGWRCSLCGAYTEYSERERRRYGRNVARDVLGEVNVQTYELMVRGSGPSGASDDAAAHQSMSGPFPAPRDGQPVFIAIIDVSACADFLELVKSGVAAAAEALPECALMGIITIADRVGLWDVKGAVPVVRHVAIFDDSCAMCPLEEAMPLRCLLAPVARYRAYLSAAVDGLAALGTRRLALGPALHTVMDFLGGLSAAPLPTAAGTGSLQHEADMRFGPARVALFMGSAPNVGRGSIVSGAAGAAAAHTPAAMPFAAAVGTHLGHGLPAGSHLMRLAAEVPDNAQPGSRNFYEQLAVMAAVLGVCIDIYAVGPHFLGLAFLEPLCQKTGGYCHYYPTVEEAALPQDLYRRVQEPQALAGLLRVRTCPELRVACAYGRLFEDPDHEQLYHVVACTPHDAVCLDLEIATVGGFLPEGGGKAPHPVIQVAFQYTVMVVRRNGDASADGAPPYELQRRMRVHTVAPRAARTPDAVFEDCQAEPIVNILMHKVVNYSAQAGPQEARRLLQEWFGLMCSRYHHHVAKLPVGAIPQPGQVDITLAQCEPLASLCSIVYALLRSPLLCTARQSHSDAAAYLRLLWGSLPPHELMRAVYPLLVSFASPDEETPYRYPLSRASLYADDAPIVLMDAFHIIFVLYRRCCDPATPFPPPPDSRLRSCITALRQERRAAPQVKYCREGDPLCIAMEDFLLDEPQSSLHCGDLAAEAMTLGYSDWCRFIQNDVQATLGKGFT